MAVAHALLEDHDGDRGREGLTDDLASAVESEVDRILAAEDLVKPAWLGPPDPGFLAIDYGRCKPRGFYTRSAFLQRYFRAVSWLQSIPFRVARDDELLTVLLLGRAFIRVGWIRDPARDPARKERMARRHLPLNSIIGLPDDWDVYRAGDFADAPAAGLPARSDETEVAAARVDHAQLDKIRAAIVDAARKAGHRPLIGDQVRLTPPGRARLARVLAFRILESYRTPSGILFGLTTRPGDEALEGRSIPSGLEIAALLGSTYAMDALARVPRVPAIIRASGRLLEGESFYLDYLRCLKRLADAPEPEAPAFMRGDAWRAKNTNTVLAGWAQMQHTFTLHAKRASYPLGFLPKPAGFVEPVPAFYGQLARLIRSAREILQRGGALGSSLGAVTSDLRVIAEKLDAFVPPKSRGRAELRFLQKLTNENPLGLQYGRLLHQLWRVEMKGISRWPPERLDRAREVLRAFIAKLESGKPLANPDLRAQIEESQKPFRSKWDKLEQMCLRLEHLARKQLRGVAFSEPESEFIADYGHALGEIMGFAGHAYLYPADTAPKVADVFSVPEKGTTVEVGIARPSALWVLYPWQGRLILCRGAVLPYYEFLSPTRLTDEEWRARLVPGLRPARPAWLLPLRPPVR